MPYLNTVTLMGHLVGDPELKHTPQGTAVVEFTLGVNSTGQNGKRSDFFDATAFGGWAENLCRTAKKGSLVLLEGFLAQERWVDKKSNQGRSRVKVKAQRVFHLEAKYADAGDSEREPRELPEEAPTEEVLY